MDLLLQHGADINLHGRNGYPLLFEESVSYSCKISCQALTARLIWIDIRITPSITQLIMTSGGRDCMMPVCELDLFLVYFLSHDQRLRGRCYSKISDCASIACGYIECTERVCKPKLLNVLCFLA